jgi:hypothetical protein
MRIFGPGQPAPTPRPMLSRWARSPVPPARRSGVRGEAGRRGLRVPQCPHPRARHRPGAHLPAGRQDRRGDRPDGKPCPTAAGPPGRCSSISVSCPGTAGSASAGPCGGPLCGGGISTRPQQAEKLLTQHGCARDVDFAADRHDGVTTLTADGMCREGRDMIDFMRRHRRPPISAPSRTGLSCAQGAHRRVPRTGPPSTTTKRPGNRVEPGQPFGRGALLHPCQRTVTLNNQGRSF